MILIYIFINKNNKYKYFCIIVDSSKLNTDLYYIITNLLDQQNRSK